jgi:hypothetical protein
MGKVVSLFLFATVAHYLSLNFFVLCLCIAAGRLRAPCWLLAPCCSLSCAARERKREKREAVGGGGGEDKVLIFIF